MNKPAHILIVDPDDNLTQVLSSILTNDGHSVTHVANPQSALQQLRKASFAVSVINATTDSTGTTRLIQDIRLRSAHTQSVVIVDRTQLHTAKHALEAGAYDCITLSTDEIQTIVTVIERAADKYRLLQENRILSDRVKQHSEGLNTITRKLQRLVTIDELTGLHNQKHFHEALAMEISRSQRYQRAFSLAIISIANFNAYQTQHGLKASELLLYSMAKILRDLVRVSDTLTRYNHTDFSLLLPETDKAGAATLLERLGQTIDNHPFPGRESLPTGRMLIHTGYALFPEHGVTSGALIEHSYASLTPR